MQYPPAWLPGYAPTAPSARLGSGVAWTVIIYYSPLIGPKRAPKAKVTLLDPIRGGITQTVYQIPPNIYIF